MFIKVFVTPSAKKEKIEVSHHAKGGKGDEILAIAVREPATGNRANNRVREIIAKWQGAPLAKVRILTGHRSRAKMISVAS
ncbi:MAG: DUF167 domain-containing protein [bacterium]|nr:DUF167 domain-containing protein [bacterium]